ncbi:hypothetical protein BGZ94_008022 [Podila epigama]|nr:hypothetical protein BGZ94_008022 [Podila epigama]
MTPMVGPTSLASTLTSHNYSMTLQKSTSNQHSNSPHTSTSIKTTPLPTEIILIILSHLDANTLLSATQTCQQWYALARRYRQYLWRRLAWQDFSFTAARDLWKLEFAADRDLSRCFPRTPPLTHHHQQQPQQQRHQTSGSYCCQVKDTTLRSRARYEPGTTSLQSKRGGSITTSATSCSCHRGDIARVLSTSTLPFESTPTTGLGLNLNPNIHGSMHQHDRVEQAETETTLSRQCACGQEALSHKGADFIKESDNFKGKHEPNQHQANFSMKKDAGAGAQRTRFRSYSSSNNSNTQKHGIDGNVTREKCNFDMGYRSHANSLLKPTCYAARTCDRTEHSGNDNEHDLDLDLDHDLLGPDEKDWRALYQLTSNWYRGRAKGYCPLMLPSLTTLASATLSIAQGSIGSHSSSSKMNFSSSSSSTASSSTTAVSSSSRSASLASSAAVARTISVSTSAQIAIQRILRKRKPQTVVGLQHEGAALTALSLAAYSFRDVNTNENEHHGSQHLSGQGIEMVNADDKGLRKQRNQCYRGGVALLRSNPHYRPRRSSSAQPHAHNNQSHPLQAHILNPAHVPGIQRPNIMAQDPLMHDKIEFAIQVAPATPTESQESQTVGGHAGANDGVATEAAAQLTSSLVLNALGQNESANDITCHFSSVLHPFIVTGHMDGSVRLWDLSIEEPGKQCIRLWHTGARQRVLCVGMNSKVVVCGNADSTLCVWDIHPAPGTTSAAHGTIHTGSYLASTVPPGAEDWVSGIDHICVGDSLVTCSTEISGSTLVFSLATGSLVYEIPGLYQHSKMCMTDFFLLTGGRIALNGREPLGITRPAGIGDRNEAHTRLHDEHEQEGWQDTDQMRQGQQGDAGLETDHSKTCCVDVWDLRTGQRLYSLIPRLPTQPAQQHQQSFNTATHLSSSAVKGSKRRAERGRFNRTSRFSPDVRSEPSSVACRSTVPNHLSEAPTAQHLPSNDQSHHFHDRNQHGTPLGAPGPGQLPQAPSIERGSQSRVYSSVRSSTGSSASHISAPLTLLDMEVTPDNSTLVVTLCERSGEGREGVYAWDFSGTRREGYHEHGVESGSTIIVDSSDLRYDEEYDEDEDYAHGGWGRGGVEEDEEEYDDERELDQLYGTRRARYKQDRVVEVGNRGGMADIYGEQEAEAASVREEDEEDGEDTDSDDDDDDDDDEDSMDLDSRFNNNIIMQQVDSTAFRDLHEARITGKVWIGWKLDDNDFQILRRRFLERVRVKRKERQLRKEMRAMKGIRARPRKVDDRVGLKEDGLAMERLSLVDRTVD